MPSINTVTELEERLSRPTAADVSAMAELDGDLLILGAGGKMGPSLAALARRAADQAKVEKRIIAVSRFADDTLRSQLSSQNIENIACDLLESEKLAKLPDTENVIFMAARKFGTTGSAHLTWAMNTYLPGLVAERYRDSRIVAFSTGNVYPLQPVQQGGAVEFRMGFVNVIWQGDANSGCLRSFAHCQSPPLVLNVTGPETLSVRQVAEEFGRHFSIEPIFEFEESPTARLSNAAKSHALLGCPDVKPSQVVEWIADWIRGDGAMLNKPTHFATRDGKF